MRRLLFLTPTAPMTSGNGLAMRCALNLEVLSTAYDVYVTVLPLVNTGYDDPAACRMCRAIEIVVPSGAEPGSEHILYPKPALSRFATPDMIRRVTEAHAKVEFDALFVFRLYTAPYASGLTGMPVYLDMDDVESDTRLRFADLAEEYGDRVSASIERVEAQKYGHAETAAVHRFDRILVASESDRARMNAKYAADRFAALPNGVHITAPLPVKPRGGAFTFLLVGTLGYRPNEDAAFHFCRDILPRIRAHTTTRIKIVIAGRNPASGLMQLTEIPDVEIRADVPDIRACYLDADAVVVPIRAAGGTRIKILESFNFGRPVVSTTMGAAGIRALNEQDLLIADDAEQFAAQCVRLVEDADLATSLARAARTFVLENHSPQSVRQAFETAGII
jgi:glycosyltransferase involved in cell wall biosynthesis